jgi:hypothetical protein
MLHCQDGLSHDTVEVASHHRAFKGSTYKHLLHLRVTRPLAEAPSSSFDGLPAACRTHPSRDGAIGSVFETHEAVDAMIFINDDVRLSSIFDGKIRSNPLAAKKRTTEMRRPVLRL